MTLKRVLECLPTISKIAKAKTLTKRLQLLKEARNCIYFAISEITLNILRGNIKISPQKTKKLQAHKVAIRKIASKEISLPTRKKLILQSGGFLPTLLIPALTILADIAANKLIK